ARFYQTLADAVEHDEVEGLSDDLTIGQLSDLLYELDSRGRIRIESKEKARERRLLSPDRAEALMLALGKPFTRALPDWMLKDLLPSTLNRACRRKRSLKSSTRRRKKWRAG